MSMHSEIFAKLSKKDRARIDAGMAAWKAERAADLVNRDWLGYLIKFDSNERLQAFVGIEDRMPVRDYWKALEMTWTGCDFAAPDCAIWERLFFRKHDPSGAIHMMSKKERRAFAALPDRFTVYRGQQDGRHRRGFSWTLSREKAEWFAKTDRSGRMHYETNGQWKKGRGTVFAGAVKKADALCLLVGRDEDEIIVHPDKVRRLKKL